MVAGAKSSCQQHHRSIVLLVLVNDGSDQCQSFMNQMLHDPILLVNTENYL